MIFPWLATGVACSTGGVQRGGGGITSVGGGVLFLFILSPSFLQLGVASSFRSNDDLSIDIDLFGVTRATASGVAPLSLSGAKCPLGGFGMGLGRSVD